MDPKGLSKIQSRMMQPGATHTLEYQPMMIGQTVCTMKNEKGQRCQGHVKEWITASPDALKKAAPGNRLHRCQRCYTIYEGPPQQYLYPETKKKRSKTLRGKESK